MLDKMKGVDISRVFLFLYACTGLDWHAASPQDLRLGHTHNHLHVVQQHHHDAVPTFGNPGRSEALRRRGEWLRAER